MKEVIDLWKGVYATYIGDDGRHRLRLFTFSITSLCIAVLSHEISGDAIATMLVAISVLTGFTFTSLFSNVSARTGLGRPRNESDRQDLAILSLLEKNFNSRAKFLIALSMVSIILMVMLTIEIYPKGIVSKAASWTDYTSNKSRLENLFAASKAMWSLSVLIVRTLTFFTFFEAIYTFYRLSETVIAILERRGQYIDAQEQ